MIEGLGKILDSVSNVKEVTGKNENVFDPDKRIENDNKKSIDNFRNIFDPDKRVDTFLDNVINKIEETHNLRELVDNYCADVIKFSDCPETLKGFNIKTSDLRNVPVEEQEALRKEFGNKKEALIKEWEQINGIEWPRYTEDVYDAKGNLIRKAGSRYDAHHKHPLSLGGANTADNITPLKADVHYDHKGVHAKGSAYDNIVGAKLI